MAYVSISIDLATIARETTGDLSELLNECGLANEIAATKSFLDEDVLDADGVAFIEKLAAELQAMKAGGWKP